MISINLAEPKFEAFCFPEPRHPRNWIHELLENQRNFFYLTEIDMLKNMLKDLEEDPQWAYAIYVKYILKRKWIIRPDMAKVELMEAIDQAVHLLKYVPWKPSLKFRIKWKTQEIWETFKEYIDRQIYRKKKENYDCFDNDDYE